MSLDEAAVSATSACTLRLWAASASGAEDATPAVNAAVVAMTAAVVAAVLAMDRRGGVGCDIKRAAFGV